MIARLAPYWVTIPGTPSREASADSIDQALRLARVGGSWSNVYRGVTVSALGKRPSPGGPLVTPQEAAARPVARWLGDAFGIDDTATPEEREAIAREMTQPSPWQGLLDAWSKEP